MPFPKKIALGFILLTFAFLYFTKQNLTNLVASLYLQTERFCNIE